MLVIRGAYIRGGLYSGFYSRHQGTKNMHEVHNFGMVVQSSCLNTLHDFGTIVHSSCLNILHDFGTIVHSSCLNFLHEHGESTTLARL